jgi:peptide/nickel transport system substrate-binding protein
MLRSSYRATSRQNDMPRFIYPLLAAASLLIGWHAGEILARPRYGGTLRIETHETIRGLDPAEWSSGIESTKEKLISLIFERLVRLDANGRPQGALALSWQHDARSRRWRFRLRTDVKFHDGTVLTPELAATALRVSTTDWKPSAQGEVLLIESDKPRPDLLCDLAQASHSIFLRGADQKVFGTGPFQLAEWDPGRRAVLSANEQHWAGRPFLDSLTIQMGRPLAEQLMDLELGKTDFVEIWPNEMRRLPKDARTWQSSPHVLIALALERGRPALEDAQLREALALSIDRAAMHSWLLQKQGEITAALLPQKLSGYAFLFPAKADMKKARQLVSKPGQATPPLTMVYDALDPLARSMAERIAVNAREAGITINVSSRQANPDIRLLRLPVRTPMPASALANLLASLHLTDIASLPENASIEAIHDAESAAVSSYRVIPLFHVPEIFGSNPQLKTWTTTGVDPFGEWHFEDMWLEIEKP